MVNVMLNMDKHGILRPSKGISNQIRTNNNFFYLIKLSCELGPIMAIYNFL